MQKTKLGISVNLLGAAMYFLALISIFPVVILAGYVLMFENSKWLIRAAVKAIAVVIFFTILSSFVGFIGNFSSFLNDLVAIFGGSINLLILNRTVSLLRTVLSFMQTLSLLLLGFKALKRGDVSISAIDSTISKHI